MKRTMMLLFPVIFLAQTGMAWQQESKPEKNSYWELRSGVAIERFQDLKVSAVTSRGTIIPIGIYKGWEKEKRKTTVGLDIRTGAITSPISSLTELSSTVLGLGYQHLRELSTEVPFFEKWYLGGSFDMRVQSLSNEKLGNSANNAIYSGGFSVVNHFERPLKFLKKDVKLTYTLNLALLSYAKEDNSLTFSVPQEALENGDFNTQDFENGLFEYGDIATLNKFNNIRSRIAIHFLPKRRASWTIAYDWRLVKYTKISDRGATSATHSLSIAYHLPKKKK